MSTDQPASTPRCGRCGAYGRGVPVQTVKALLRVSLRRMLSHTYWLCATPDCPVVYFSSDPPHYFSTVDIRTVVYQKFPDTPTTPICYCFHYTVSDVRDSLPGALQIIIADITNGIRADQCACEWRNPQGACCLGNVRQYLKTPTPHNKYK